MFGQFFVKSFLVFFLTLFIALILVDDLYQESVAQDELAYTKGIKHIVSKDGLNASDQSKQLAYWNDQFPYEFSIVPFSSLNWSESALRGLKNSGNFVEITTGWLTDHITVNYYFSSCDCVLRMHKQPLSNDTWNDYLQVLFISVVAILGCFVFWHTRRHKRFIKALSHTYESYGKGQFDVRANEQIPLPYTPLATNFNQMAEKIHALLLEQKIMVNGVSHDIRTPIARLRFALDLTRSSDSIEALRRHIQDMDMDLDELDLLINEWLFYAELTSNSKQVSYNEPIPLHEMLTEKMHSLAPIYPHVSIISSISDANFSGNQRLITRCIENLLTNAFKYACAQIKLTITLHNDNINLVVEDDGPGINGESIEHLVQPFIKSPNQCTTKSYGLGLAIVKAIAEQHGATLTAAASELGGAKFEIQFHSAH